MLLAFYGIHALLTNGVTTFEFSKTRFVFKILSEKACSNLSIMKLFVLFCSTANSSKLDSRDSSLQKNWTRWKERKCFRCLRKIFYFVVEFYFVNDIWGHWGEHSIHIWLLSTILLSLESRINYLLRRSTYLLEIDWISARFI